MSEPSLFDDSYTDPHTDLYTDPPRTPLTVSRDPNPPIINRKELVAFNFGKFHTNHPEVYRELVRLARQQILAGTTRLSIAQLFEVVRYNRSTRPDVTEEFLLNNNYKPFYARLMMDAEIDLFGMFEVREMTRR